jgi:phosphocarrier protein HPr
VKEVIIKIQNPTGLHARPASIIVKCALGFQSSISIKKGEKEVNLKSLISLLSLGICKNDEILLKADGIDENQAIENIVSVLDNLKD